MNGMRNIVVVLLFTHSAGVLTGLGSLTVFLVFVVLSREQTCEVRTVYLKNANS